MNVLKPACDDDEALASNITSKSGVHVCVVFVMILHKPTIFHRSWVEKLTFQGTLMYVLVKVVVTFSVYLHCLWLLSISRVGLLLLAFRERLQYLYRRDG